MCFGQLLLLFKSEINSLKKLYILSLSAWSTFTYEQKYQIREQKWGIKTVQGGPFSLGLQDTDYTLRNKKD